MTQNSAKAGVEATVATASDKKLRKALTLQDLFFMSMGGIIGSGWLFAVDSGAYFAGPAVVLSWIIGGIIVLFIALNYAEISGAIPRSGAIVRYPHLSHGGFTGYILGWAYLLSAVTVPAIEAEAVLGYAGSYIKGIEYTYTAMYLGQASPYSKTILTDEGIFFALLLMVVFFFLNYAGVRFLGKFNTVVTWWKFVLPVLTFLFLFAVFRASNFSAFGGFAPLGWGPVFLAIPGAGIVFSYLGFRQALEFGGEAKNPQRDVPRATIYSVVAAIAVYSLLQFAFIGAINWAKGGYVPGDWASLSAGPLSAAPLANSLKYTGIAAIAAFAYFLYADAYISPSGTGWIYLGTGTRTFYGLAADGYYPSKLLSISKTKIPWLALIAALVIGAIFLAPFPSWYLLVGFISTTTVFTYILGPLAVHIFRKHAPNMKRPFRLPAAWLFAPLGFVGASLIVYWSAYTGLFYVWTAIFLGLPVFYLLYARSKLKISMGVAAVLGIVQFVAVLIISYWGYANTFVWFFVNGFAPPASQSTITTNFLIYFVLLALAIFIPTLITQFVAKGEDKQILKASYWLLTLAFFLYIISFFGATGGPFGSNSVLKFPYDNVVVIIGGLLIYGWGVISGYKTEDLQEIEEFEGEAEAPPAETQTASVQ